MDQSNEPLARRLHRAAIDRTVTDAERVDDFVLDADGVVDLREFDRDPAGASVADPARVLAMIRGQLGDAHEVSDLYDDSTPNKPRWRRGRRSGDSDGETAPPSTNSSIAAADLDAAMIPPSPSFPLPSRLAIVPLATDAGGTDDETGATPRDTHLSPARSMAESVEPEIDLRDENRPTADCPKCMGLSHRDLFDRFSQVEFYSCDNCLHMWQQDLS
jgi:hypothetical protein